MEIDENGGFSMPSPTLTKMDYGASAAAVHNGRVTCQLQNGSLDQIVLDTHSMTATPSTRRGGSQERLEACFCQRLALKRFSGAWDIAVKMNSDAHWLALAAKAMESLNLSLALRVYRATGDAGMVQALQKISNIEDKNLLAGHVSAVFSEYAQAQQLFLASARPAAALEMRRDLMHWDHALKLAATIDPTQVPTISFEYAQLEFKGEFPWHCKCTKARLPWQTSSTAPWSHQQAERMLKVRETRRKMRKTSTPDQS